MISDSDTPDEAYWVEVGGDSRIHPYAMHKIVNQDEIEVVSVISEEDSDPKRWVIVRDGQHEVWVKVQAKDEYGYELQQDERVSEAELHAITRKQRSIRDGSNVPVEEARAFAESCDPEQLPHALVALFYAAKADPDVTVEDVDTLRKIMHEHTNHVDTGHEPTVRRILADVKDDEEGPD